ncbi:DUF1380 family protein [Cedecea sp. NFIX57]|uniref:DUF1380 family protein n=1 Tax=Cedecea sp. NFIX57 TaxID=1566286 RepID=UPI000A0B358E|nr:DUF1380 family protein [Cedecea sp. NFIX57]SMG61952.1 Protein of unknown function [Cedecea sp. NFIX57]
MYGTREALCTELERMFTPDEPLALLVWTEEGVHTACPCQSGNGRCGDHESAAGSVRFGCRAGAPRFRLILHVVPASRGVTSRAACGKRRASTLAGWRLMQGKRKRRHSHPVAVFF